MKTYLIISIVFFSVLFPLYLKAQYFNRNYGTDSTWEYTLAVVEVPTEGYIFAYDSHQYNSNYNVLNLVKVNPEGYIIWQKAYNDTNLLTDTWSLTSTTDGNFVLAGEVWNLYRLYNYNEASDMFLMKFNSEGDSLWLRTYSNSTGDDQAIQVAQTSDGGYIITGVAVEPDTSNSDLILVKIDSNGNEQWHKTYGGTGYDVGLSVVQTDEKGYMVAGYSQSYGTGDRDGYLLRVDSMGNQLWDLVYETDLSQWFQYLYSRRDGTYLACGTWKLPAPHNILGQGEGWIICFDNAGETLWERMYGGASHDIFDEVRELEDGSIVAAGTTSSFNPNKKSDGWIMKMDTDGDSLWARTYNKWGGDNYSYFYALQATSDRGFITAGFSTNFAKGINGQDAWVVKMDSLGCDTPGCRFNTGVQHPASAEEAGKMLLYPNPLTSVSTLHLSLPQHAAKAELFITDLLGRTVKTYHLNPDEQTLLLKASDFNPGIYSYSLRVNGVIVGTRRMIILK